MQDINPLSLFENAVDHSIDSRFTAVEEVPQPARFVRYRPAVGQIFKIQNGLFKACVPPARRRGVFGVDFVVERNKVAPGPRGDINEIGHARL